MPRKQQPADDPVAEEADESDNPTEVEPAEAAEPEQEPAEEPGFKRCRDHPTNFPDEDPMRLRTEFRMHGKYLSPYCRRCQNIRHRRYRLAPAKPKPVAVPEPVSESEGNEADDEAEELDVPWEIDDPKA